MYVYVCMYVHKMVLQNDAQQTNQPTNTAYYIIE
jgi:hypothetical protein